MWDAEDWGHASNSLKLLLFVSLPMLSSGSTRLCIGMMEKKMDTSIMGLYREYYKDPLVHRGTIQGTKGPVTWSLGLPLILKHVSTAQSFTFSSTSS